MPRFSFLTPTFLTVIITGILGVYFILPRTPTGQVRQIANDDTALTQYIQAHGVKATLQTLLRESDQNNSFSCHQPAHQIGRIAYQVVGKEAFQQCDGSCHSGCYHGAMESLLNQEGTSHFTETIETTCQIFNTSFGTHQCFHGVGHGVLAYLDYDLPAALNECRKLPIPYHQSSCMGGVFMENIATGRGLGAKSVDGDEHQTTWLSQDPHFPCNKISTDSITQQECYLMQTSWMLTIFKYNFAKVVPQCLQAPPDQIATCFQSYGRDAVDQDLNPQKILARCAKIPDVYYDSCVKGGLNVIVDFWGTDLKSQASDMCGAIIIDEHRATCYQNLSVRLHDLFDQLAPPKAGSPQQQTIIPAATIPPVGQTLTIKINEQGFIPKEITIQKGQTVTFINTGTNPHWPASNLHPSHKLYPEFDPKNAIAPGQLWSFTFWKVGTWRMHDHRYPNLSGAITVIE